MVLLFIMKNIIFKTFISFLIFFSSLANAAFKAEPFTAVYSLSKAGLTVGETTVTLKRSNNNEYIYTSTSTTTGLAAMFIDDTVIEQSRFTIKNNAIHMLEYHYTHSGKPHKNRKLIFDWKNNVATEQVAKQKWKIKLQPDSIDKHAYRYALMMDIANNKNDIQYTVTDDDKLATYHFVKQSPVEIHTALGELNTNHLKMERDKKTTILFWCAPKLGNLPVRVEKDSKKNGKLTLKLVSVNGEYFSAKYQEMPPK